MNLSSNLQTGPKGEGHSLRKLDFYFMGREMEELEFWWGGREESAGGGKKGWQLVGFYSPGDAVESSSL